MSDTPRTYVTLRNGGWHRLNVPYAEIVAFMATVSDERDMPGVPREFQNYDDSLTSSPLVGVVTLRAGAIETARPES